MNQGLLITLAVLTTCASWFNPSFLTAPPSSRTPNIPSSGHHRQSRAYAPADGRWHMKFHRGRV